MAAKPPVSTVSEAMAANPPLGPAASRVRPSVEQSNISALSAAYETMQGRSEGDNRSWIYWSEFHGYNRFDCWHHGSQGSQSFPYDLFLPWHRAYLHYFEFVAFPVKPGVLATIVPGVALPWWDWTSALSHKVGLPASFSAAEVGGQPNPLASGPTPPALGKNPPRTSRNPGNPAALPSAQTIEHILEIPSFEEFSRELQNQHDRVHGWTGGDMGNIAMSAFDPIFWSHHTMIDRLWYLWQQRHGVSNIPPNYLNLVLAPWKLTVKDVLDVTSLGYTYGVSRIMVPFERFKTTILNATAGS